MLVTGASSGIGAATARRLNALGATIIAVGRNEEHLAKEKENAEFPEHFHLEQKELLENMEELPGWVRALCRKYGKLRGLVNCAGYHQFTSLRQYDLADARKMFDLHFHAPMLLAGGFADRRSNTGQGAAMVFLASIVAFTAHKGVIAYGPAKAALVSAIGHMGQELAPQGMRANCISPGMVRAGMSLKASSVTGSDAFLEHEEAAYPLGLGRAEDIADMAAFLLSDNSRWITGKNFTLDGGRCLHA